jgi:hypothetical protein
MRLGVIVLVVATAMKSLIVPAANANRADVQPPLAHQGQFAGHAVNLTLQTHTNSATVLTQSLEDEHSSRGWHGGKRTRLNLGRVAGRASFQFP